MRKTSRQSDTAATPLSQRTSTARTRLRQSAPEKNAIIITGTRRALRTSQQIKKNADTVVDSITATDIGAFPDKSVAEALQRVPGITVNRFAATSDTAHFSAEPSGVIIRGLPQVRSEFNGRDTFSANSSRGLSWTDITPELLAGRRRLQEPDRRHDRGRNCRHASTLRTRVPFDATGQLIQVGARANYGDLDKKWTPDVNGFYSNRWQTGAGEFGIMANLAYSQVKTRSQGIQYGRTRDRRKRRCRLAGAKPSCRLRSISSTTNMTASATASPAAGAVEEQQRQGAAHRAISALALQEHVAGR